MEPRALVERIYRHALSSVSPRARTAAAVADLAAARDLAPPVTILAVGKAAASMAAGAHDALGPGALDTALVVVPPSVPIPVPVRDLRVAAHPVPDESSLAAGEALLSRAAAQPADATLILLLSGGASALACVPAYGVPFVDKRLALRSLAAAGAPIAALNAVRKHLSRLKGGRLAAATSARLHALVWSDVLGDDASVVGGGPASPDPTTCADAIAALRVHGVWDGAPVSVREHLERAGDETPKPGDRRLARASVRVLAGPDELLAAAAAAARRYAAVEDVEPRVADPVHLLAARLSARALALARGLAPGETGVMLAGGEPVVRLPAAPGRGGRAQHTAWLCASELSRMAWPAGVRVAVLAAGSDGTDGPTGDAGGVVDAGSWARASAAGIDPERALARFDAGCALAAAGDLFTTGPTGNNLCDLFVVCAARAPGLAETASYEPSEGSASGSAGAT